MFEAKAEAEAKALRPRPRPRPKFWPRGLNISGYDACQHDLNIALSTLQVSQRNTEMDINFSKELDLSSYIPEEKLSAMSDLEQRCCANRIRNYEMLKSLGIIIIS